MAQPIRGHVRGEFGRQLRRPGGSQILKQLRPRLHPGLGKNPLELRPEIRIGVAVAGDDVGLRAILGLHRENGVLRKLPGVFQVGTKLRKDRNDAAVLSLVMLRLGASDGHSAVEPVDVDPFESQVLGGASQPAVAAQGEEQLPLGVRAKLQHLICDVARDEMIARPIGAHGNPLHLTERIFGDETLAQCGAKELARDAAPTADRVVAELLAIRAVGTLSGSREPSAPVVGVAGGDFAKRLRRAEVLQQAFLGVAVDVRSARLHIRSPFNVRRQKRPQRRLLRRRPLRHEPDVRELVIDQRLELADPR